MKKYLAVAIVAALATFVYAQPSIDEGTRELSLEGGWDSDGPTGTELDLSVGYGIFMRDALEVGGIVGYESTIDGDSKSWRLGAFVEHHFDMATMTVPYVGARLVYASYDNPVTDEGAIEYGPRVGVKHFIADNVAIDIALQYMFATEDVFVNDGVAEDTDLSIVFGIRAMF